MNRELSYRDKNLLLYQAVNMFISAVKAEHFHMGLHEDSLLLKSVSRGHLRNSRFWHLHTIFIFHTPKDAVCYLAINQSLGQLKCLHGDERDHQIDKSNCNSWGEPNFMSILKGSMHKTDSLLVVVSQYQLLHQNKPVCQPHFPFALVSHSPHPPCSQQLYSKHTRVCFERDFRLWQTKNL